MNRKNKSINKGHMMVFNEKTKSIFDECDGMKADHEIKKKENGKNK
jgi:hypothetical protein